jgi:murein DD-endopeptidase MepM/ murein hydrolase activator NlpD
VKKGDPVNKGQPLCRVGNSGNTSEPHLHIHVIKTGGDLLYEGEGVPMKFHNRFLVRNDIISSFSGVQKGK